MSQDISEEEYNKYYPKNMLVTEMGNFLKKKKNPIVLEFGVNKGGSTKKFIWLAEKINGKVYSVDIEDCSNISNSKNWKFLKSDDLEINYVLENFPEIKEKGADLIFIDSYHENSHVTKLLKKYFKYVKKNGAIFIDDIDSSYYRQRYDSERKFDYLVQSIVYDLTSDAVREFYYNNMDKGYYSKHYGETGLGKFYKTADLFEEANPDKKLWIYNPFIKILYPYLRKIFRAFKLKKN